MRRPVRSSGARNVATLHSLGDIGPIPQTPLKGGKFTHNGTSRLLLLLASKSGVARRAQYRALIVVCERVCSANFNLQPSSSLWVNNRNTGDSPATR